MNIELSFQNNQQDQQGVILFNNPINEEEIHA